MTKYPRDNISKTNGIFRLIIGHHELQIPYDLQVPDEEIELPQETPSQENFYEAQIAQLKRLRRSSSLKEIIDEDPLKEEDDEDEDKPVTDYFSERNLNRRLERGLRMLYDD
jgi:hypothetical protein